MTGSKNGWALITGASGGIGLEFAKLLAGQKKNLVLVARNKSALDEQAVKFRSEQGVEVKVIATDLSVATSPQEIYEELSRDSIEIDLLINNAGFAVYGSFNDNDLRRETDMLNLNITALTVLTKLFLKGMLERKSGGILNVASTAAFQPGAYAATYFASKAYVLHFSEALALELEETGVTVTCLCPGTTNTGFFKESGWGDSLLKSKGRMTAHDVAKAGLRGLKHGRTVVITGWFNKLMAFSVRFGSRRFVSQATAVLTRPAKGQGNLSEE